ncbi:MAG TPA: response regulator [Acetobacteraceae bacterium]|nr:response regulator [Acetobacteraceae bacterium]
MTVDVLLVEDDDLVRECLAEALHEAGLETAERASGEDALELLTPDTKPPAVVVTDINLGPGMNGLAFAEAARRCWPSVAVIYISGRYQGLNELGGRDRFVPKPFPMGALLRAIRDVGASDRKS